jgi:hypothetical protein
MKSRALLIALAGTVAILGCGGSDTTAPETGLNQADLNELANGVDVLASQMLANAAASAFGGSFSLSAIEVTPRTTASAVNRSLGGTYACPVSGTVIVSGTVTGSYDQAAQDLSVTVTATHTAAACGLSTSRGTVTITGNPNVGVSGTINVVAGKPSGPQSLRHVGSFTWARGTSGGSCSVDVTSTYNPAAGMLTVAGTLCGRSVTYSHTAPKFI